MVKGTSKIDFPMYIGGQRHLSESDEIRDVTSPATGERLGRLAYGTPVDVDLAVRAAQAAAQTLAKMTVFERAELCVSVADVLASRREETARTLSKEHGKPLHTEASAEIDACVAAFREAAEQIKWMNSTIVPMRDPSKRAFSYRRPRGVYGVITPWNFPLGVACIYYLAPGLAAGNTMVWVPAPSTSAVASKLMECIDSAGVPEGVINMVTGEGPVVGDALVVHPNVNAIAFTGNTSTGKTIASRAAGKPCLLELGGNGPSIVLEDADLNVTATAIADGSFANAGQICTSTERILAHNSVADELVERLSVTAAKIQVGDPIESSTTMGPVHTKSSAERVLNQIGEASTKGAKIVTGGSTLEDMPTEQFIQPTVLDHVSADTHLNKEETFGPVSPVVRFSKTTDLPGLVASSPFGLSGAIFSRDVERAMVLAEDLPCGIVNINDASSYWEPQTPAGGASGRTSGYGRSGGAWSIEEMSDVRTIVLNLAEKERLG